MQSRAHSVRTLDFGHWTLDYCLASGDIAAGIGAGLGRRVG
jgi:hypothetical protein